jgi:hypothetical protein
MKALVLVLDVAFEQRGGFGFVGEAQGDVGGFATPQSDALSLALGQRGLARLENGRG